MTIDVGTGDGRAVLAVATREPETLVIGLDPVAAAMRESSARAAGRPERGGYPNALFLVAAAETTPLELLGLADLVTVRLPWASLLRGCLGGDPAVAAGLVALLGPGGVLELTLAPSERDGLAGTPAAPADVAAAARTTFGGLGLRPGGWRKATADELRATGSTWARRLLGSSRRGSDSGRQPIIISFRSP